MDFDVQIIPYRPEFRRRVAELRSSMFGHSPALNEEYLQWKYDRNPFPEATVLFLALDGDRIVGMRGLFGTKWEFSSGHIVSMSQDAEVMVVPDHRGRGIFRAMDIAALSYIADRGVSHMISMSSNAANRAAAARLGWTEMGSYQFARRRARGWPLEPELSGWAGAAIRRRLRWSPFGKGQFHRFDQRANSRLPSGSLWAGSRVEVDSLVQVTNRSPKPRPIYPLKNAEYLSWRFDNPIAEYRFLYSGHDPVDGYLVLAKANPWHVWILDLDATNTDVARNLLSAAITYASRAALDVWTVSLAEDQADLLEEFAFRDLLPNASPAADGAFMVRPTAVGDMSLMLHGVSLKDVANWDLRMISSDAY